MAFTHKAISLSGPNQRFSIITAETPQPTSGQVLVRVYSVLINPTYKLIFSGAIPVFRHFPVTPGGSSIGRVEAVGPDAISVQVGQLVFVDPAISSRDDPDQKIVHGTIQGFTEKAARLAANGWRNGAMAEKVIVPLENVVPLDEKYWVDTLGYSFDKIHMFSRFVLTYGGYKLAKFQPGDTVIIAWATGA